MNFITKSLLTSGLWSNFWTL